MTLVVGIIGSLMGVVAGAFLTRWIDASYERRREVRQTVASALILREELKDARAGFDAMAGLKRFSPMYLFCGIEEWDAHRHLLLAAGMSHENWSKLAQIFRSLLEVRESLRRIHPETDTDDWPEFGDDMVKWLTEIAKECEEGRSFLEPFIVEDAVPLFRPNQIFDRG
jgi:hypothetical protein